MSLYKYKDGDAESFSQLVGIKTRRRGNQLEFMFCPYCRSTKDKWKFGISVATGQFECKRSSCGVKGNMITLSRDFDFSLGKDADAYYRTADYSKKQYRDFKNAHRPIESKPLAIAYMLGRGISEEVSVKYEITNLNEQEHVIVFPFRDEDGTLTFVKYRNSIFKKGETKGAKEWCASNHKPILFGMNHCDVSKDNGDLIITEGQIDSLSVVMAGYTNAVSVPTGANGFTWIPYCYDFVNKFNRIIVMGDCENGKITLVDELSKRWPTKIRVCRQEDYKGCKDANELWRQDGTIGIKAAIENAEAPYNAHIKPLAKVRQVDIMKIEAIATGLPEVDEILDGGFRMGQLAVLTGKRGEGKSTLASMFGVRALEQGYNCFFYSGELPDFFFRNWMDCQVTGKAEHSQSDNDKLDVWYGDKAFIYDDTLMHNDDELVSLIETIEIAIIQNNCRFILLDNLMTAIDDDLSTDLYRNQSKFIGNLAAIAKRYNVFILLIAHPKKTNNDYLGNDDVSGSSHITDKADIVLSYSRPQRSEDPDETHRRLIITKNRLTGKLATSDNPIKLVYDQKSRRVACSTPGLFEIRFNWNDDPYGFDEVDEEEVPF